MSSSIKLIKCLMKLQSSHTFQLLQVFRYTPNGFLGLRIIEIWLPSIALVFLPFALGQQFLEEGGKREREMTREVTREGREITREREREREQTLRD